MCTTNDRFLKYSILFFSYVKNRNIKHQRISDLFRQFKSIYIRLKTNNIQVVHISSQKPSSEKVQNLGFHMRDRACEDVQLIKLCVKALNVETTEQAHLSRQLLHLESTGRVQNWTLVPTPWFQQREKWTKKSLNFPSYASNGISLTKVSKFSRQAHVKIPFYSCGYVR